MQAKPFVNITKQSFADQQEYEQYAHPDMTVGSSLTIPLTATIAMVQLYSSTLGPMAGQQT